IRHGTDEQATIRATLNRELARRGVFIRNQPLSRGYEVVEHVLLLQLRARLVPLLAVLTTATHVCRRVNNTLFEQRQTQRAKRRRLDHIETAVTVKQRRVIAVKLQAFFVDQKHRHARAIFALVKDLPGLIVLGLEAGNIDRAKDGRLLRRDVVLVNRAWESERV